MTKAVLAQLPITLELVEGYEKKNVFRSEHPFIVGDFLSIGDSTVAVINIIERTDEYVVFELHMPLTTAHTLDAVRLSFIVHNGQLEQYIPPHELPFLKLKTDLERFKELYRSFGIECVVNPNVPSEFSVTPINADPEGWQYYIQLEGYIGAAVTKSDKFNGYGGFYTVLFFDADGKFIAQHFYE